MSAYTSGDVVRILPRWGYWVHDYETMTRTYSIAPVGWIIVDRIDGVFAWLLVPQIKQHRDDEGFVWTEELPSLSIQVSLSGLIPADAKAYAKLLENQRAAR